MITTWVDYLFALLFVLWFMFAVGITWAWALNEETPQVHHGPPNPVVSTPPAEVKASRTPPRPEPSGGELVVISAKLDKVATMNEELTTEIEKLHSFIDDNMSEIQGDLSNLIHRMHNIEKRLSALEDKAIRVYGHGEPQTSTRGDPEPIIDGPLSDPDLGEKLPPPDQK